MHKPERIKHPFRKGYTCIMVKIPCTCPCHGENQSIMHFMACCNNMFIEFPTDEKPIEDNIHD